MWHKCFVTRIHYPIVVVHMSHCTTDTTRHTWHWCFGMCINYLIQNSHVSDCNTDNISNLGHRYFGLCIHYMTHVYLLYIWIYCHKLISLYIYLFPCIFLQTQMSVVWSCWLLILSLSKNVYSNRILVPVWLRGAHQLPGMFLFCIYKYVYIYMYILIFMHVYSYTCIYVHIYIYAHIQVYKYVYM